MFTFGDKSRIIDKARKVSTRGNPEKAIQILENSLTNEESDLSLILEIMHIYLNMDKLNEVIVWAKKGESLTPEASKQILSEVEDLYYGQGHPDELAEYIIEKNIEARNFDGVIEVVTELTKEGRNRLIKREQRIIENINTEKEHYSGRDLTHLYMQSFLQAGMNSKKTSEHLFNIAKKNPKEMERILEAHQKISQEYFGDEWLQLGLGEILLMQKYYERGISNLKTALKRNKELRPDVIEVLNEYKDDSREIMDFLSELYIDMGKDEKAMELVGQFESEEAIKKYQRMVKTNPDKPEIHKNLAEAYINKNRYSEAMNEYLKAVELSPEEDYGKRVKELEDSLPEEINPYLQLARIYETLGWIEDSVNILNKAYKIAPSTAEEIMDELNNILKESEHSTEALTLKAKLYSRKGDVDKAIEIYKELAEMDEGVEIAREGFKTIEKENPSHTEARLIHLMFKVPDQPGEIAQEVNRIISDEPGYIPILLREYDNWIRHNPGVVSNFINFFEFLDSENFPPFTYPFELAELHRINENYDSAEKYYIEALSEDQEKYNFLLKHLIRYKDTADIRRILASLYLHKGEYKKGCLEIKNASEQFPEDVSNITRFVINQINSGRKHKCLYQTLTEILLKNNYYEEAIKWGEKALESVSVEEKSDLLLQLAEAHAEANNYSKTAKLVREAYGIDSSISSRAVKILEEAAEEKTTSEINMALYELHRDSGDVVKASFYLDNLLKENPSMSEMVRKEFEKLIDKAPIEAVLRLRYGRARLLSGDEKGLEEIEKGLRFNPDLKDNAIEILDNFEDSEIETKSILLKGNILSEMDRKKEATRNFISAYWKDKENRNQILSRLESVSSEIEPDRELTGELFKIYTNEGRNPPVVELINRYFDGSRERGEFLISEIEKYFSEALPLPIKLSKSIIDYRIGNKERASDEMIEIMKKHPETAENFSEVVEPDDEEMLPVLINMNLELNRWKSTINNIKKLRLKERAPYYERLLEKDPGNQTAKKNLAYLYFLMDKKEKAKELLQEVTEQTVEDEMLKWYLGQEIEVKPDGIKDFRKNILKDKLNFKESPYERAEIMIELEDYENAYREVKKIDGVKREIILSKIELKLGNYDIAYNRLNNIEDNEEVLKLKYYATIKRNDHKISLNILPHLNLSPEETKKQMTSILDKSCRDFKQIRPILRRK